MKSNIIEKCLIAFLSLQLIILPACSDNPNSAADTAPEIPPIGTMTADLSFFSDNGHPLQKAADAQANNFLQAALRVGIVNLFILVGSAIPVVATVAAFSAEPVLQEDGKFHWIHSNTTTNVELELTAQVNPGNVNWEMFVSRQQPTVLEQFRWYEGENQIGGKTGYWIFYDENSPDDDTKTVRIDWTYNEETDRELIITNIHEGNAYNGSSITYTVDGDNVTLLYFDATTDAQVEISWNRVTQTGYLIDPNYENGTKSCWDEQLHNIDCP